MTNFWKCRAIAAATLAFSVAGPALAQPDRLASPIDKTRNVILRGNTHPKAQPRYDQGLVEPSFRLGYIIMMFKQTAVQRAALDQLLRDQQNPSSPMYRKWLTPEQYADRFGLSQSDIAKIATWLASEGFTVESTARGRDWIAFSGTAAQVRSAFHTEVHRYAVDGENHFAIASEPSVPGALEPLVAALLGLDNFRPKPASKFHPATTLPPGTITLAPDDLAVIYNLRSLYRIGIDGTGQTIAVVGLTSIDPNDIQAFRARYALGDVALQLIQTGLDPGFDQQFISEAALDLEWSSAVAPGASLVYVYSADLTLARFLVIDQALALVLSDSFVSCEPMLPDMLAAVYEAEAQKANSIGITWLNAAGDTGAAACDEGVSLATQGLAVNFPASLPEVTAVGGTEFNEGTGAGNFWSTTNGPHGGSAQSYVPEMAWNDNVFVGGLASTGGGVSTLFAKPDWQAGPGVPDDGARDVPDVSMTASAPHDPYNVIAGGFVQLQGGTSAATPVFAGIVALLNQYLQTNGAPDQAPGVGNINPTLYQLAQSVPAIFHDIVNGSNIVPCDPASPDCANGQLGYSAGPGYDLVTGLGSVDAYNLVTQWNGIPGGAPAIAGLAPASTTAGGVSFKLTVNGSNFAAGAQVQWNGTALPTAVVNSTQLTATVDTKLIAAPGVVAITVAQGGAGSGVFYFTVHASASMALVYGNQRVTKTAPNVCNVPQAMNSFLTTDAAIYLWFQATITANDRFVVSWLAPDGSVGNFVFGGLQPATNYCALTLSYPISNLPASLLGPWQVRLYDNATQLFSIPFTVSAP